MLDEAERSLHDALCVLSQTVQDSRVILGGGWAEMQARAGRLYAAAALLPALLRSLSCAPAALALARGARCRLSPGIATPRAASRQMARVVDDLAARTPGKKSLAMAAFGHALRQIPTIICDNAGEARGLRRPRVLLLPLQGALRDLRGCAAH